MMNNCMLIWFSVQRRKSAFECSSLFGMPAATEAVATGGLWAGGYGAGSFQGEAEIGEAAV